MAVTYRSDIGSIIIDASATATGSFVTLPVAGDAVFAGGCFNGGGSTFTPKISDNQGGTSYTLDESKKTTAAGTESTAVIGSRLNVTTGGTFTVTFDCQLGGASFYAVSAVCFSNVLTASALDVHTNAGTENADAASQVTGTTGTTAQADEVSIIAHALDNSISVTTITASGYTLPVSSPDGTAHAVGAFGYKILVAQATQAATFAYGLSSGAASNDHGACISVYKGLASATSISYLPLLGAG